MTAGLLTLNTTMNTYTVTIAVSIPVTAEVEVVADSQEAANNIVTEAFDSSGYNSQFYRDADFDSPDWSVASDLRVVW